MTLPRLSTVPAVDTTRKTATTVNRILATSANAMAVTTRTDLANAAKSSTVIFDGGLWIFQTGDLSALVSADTTQGIYVAPASDTTGASGAWVRQFSGPAQSTWFGVSTSATDADNTTAFTAALTTLNALKISSFGHNGGSIGLHTQAGHYLFNNTLTIPNALEVSGDYVNSGGGTVFEWTSDTNGFDALSPDCNGAAIRGLMLIGTGGGSNCHAVNQTGNLKVIDVFGKTWSGDCVHADSTSGGLSGSEWRNVTAEAVGWTLYIQGADSNACTGFNISAGANRFGSVLDSSGIGCHFIGGVCNRAGLETGFVTRCESGGNIYMVAFGQEAGASTNAPTGTTASNTYWWFIGTGSASATQPAWTSGQTWYFSSPFCSQPDDGNVRTLFAGVYAESGLNAIVMSDASLVISGQILVPVLNQFGTGHGGYIRGDRYYTEFSGGIEVNGNALVSAGNAYYVDSIQVVGARNTGWSADTGTARKSSNTTYVAPTASATYDQTQMQNAVNALQVVQESVAGIKNALIGHGLLG